LLILCLWPSSTFPLSNGVCLWGRAGARLRSCPDSAVLGLERLPCLECCRGGWRKACQESLPCLQCWRGGGADGRQG